MKKGSITRQLVMAVVLFSQTSLCATDQEEREEEEERDGFLHKHRMSRRRAAAGPSGLLKTHAHHHHHHHYHRHHHNCHQIKTRPGAASQGELQPRVQLHHHVKTSSSVGLQVPQVKNTNFSILPPAAELHPQRPLLSKVLIFMWRAGHMLIFMGWWRGEKQLLCVCVCVCVCVCPSPSHARCHKALIAQNKDSRVLSGHNAVLMLWLGLGVKSLWLGLGNHQRLAKNTWSGCHKHGWKCPEVSSETPGYLCQHQHHYRWPEFLS